MKYIFLLGGRDLEMLEIKKILKENDEKFIDKNLSWGAKWSDYNNCFNLPEHKDKIFVGIELSGKDKRPTGALDIDHHNFNSDKDASIEQIAELLNIELTRKQKLIAANDKAYIKGMEMLCATKEEIDKIRQADKKAQGVTEEDERLAEKSIKNNQVKIGDVTIIKSLTEKFSPITDLMYNKTNKLIIYNDSTLNYYGAITDRLIKEYKSEIGADKTYYGGKKSAGYFGLAKGSWSKDEIIEQKEKILEIVKNKKESKIFSHHIFLFPFKWKKWNADSKATLIELFDISIFKKLDENGCWCIRKFELNHFDHYNEYNYFYEYVREIMYDLDENLITERTAGNDKLINHYEYQFTKPLYYNIKLKGNNVPYNLEIDSILLNVYATGTAVLSFHLRNHLYPNKDDILKINKFGRRLFVPFFDLKPDSIYDGEKDLSNEDKDFDILCSTKLYEIPDAIWIGNEKEPQSKDNDNLKLYENFEGYKDTEYFKNGPFNLPKFITGLFPENFFLTHEKQGYLDEDCKKKNDKYKVYLRPVLDDRMYVVSWYGNSELVDTLNKVQNTIDVEKSKDGFTDNRKCKSHYSYETDPWWYSYIYVDTEPMHTDRFIRKQLTKKQTYSRWVELETLYGMSRYSLVMLTGDFSKIPSYLVRHLQSMYYKMAELCLLQRATVLSFSDEVVHVSNLMDDDDKKITERIESLYKHYILFVNKIYFREITAQEQGIEMYDMMQQAMRIPQDVKDLDNEIDELNRFASIMADKRDGEQSKKHTWLASIFLPAMLISGILGMNVFTVDNIPEWFVSCSPVWSFWIPTIVILLFTLCYAKWNCCNRIKKLFKNKKQ